MNRFKDRYPRPAFVDVMLLVEYAAKQWDVEAWRIARRERTRDVAFPRFGVVWALRQMNMPYMAIANHLHFREHKGAKYAEVRAEQMRAEDPNFRRKTDDLLAFALLNFPLVEPIEQAA